LVFLEDRTNSEEAGVRVQMTAVPEGARFYAPHLFGFRVESENVAPADYLSIYIEIPDVLKVPDFKSFVTAATSPPA